MGARGISDTFIAAEFACHDGSPTPPAFIPRLEQLHGALMKIRAACEAKLGIKTELILVSGYRSLAHNTKVGGEPKSLHMEAKAGDVKVRGLSPDFVAEIAMRLQVEGKIPMGGVGRYNTFTHVDIRGTRARWDNRKPSKPRVA